MKKDLFVITGARPGSAGLAIGRALKASGFETMHSQGTGIGKRYSRNSEKYDSADWEYFSGTVHGYGFPCLNFTSMDSIGAFHQSLQQKCKDMDLNFRGMAVLSAGGGDAGAKIIGAQMPELSPEELHSARLVNYLGVRELLAFDKLMKGNLFTEGFQFLGLTFLANMADFPMSEYGHMRQMKNELEENYQSMADENPGLGFGLISTGPFDSMSANAIPRFPEFRQWYSKEMPEWTSETGLLQVGDLSMHQLADSSRRGYSLEYCDGGFHNRYINGEKGRFIQSMQKMEAAA